MTAAHNLYDQDEDELSTHLYFVPAYNQEEMPFGYWLYDDYWIPQQYLATGADAYDLGLVHLEDNPDTEQSIGDAVGWLGVKTGLPPSGLNYIQVGYPDEIMMQSPGAYTRSIEDGGVIGKHGQLDVGASGGPWLLSGDNTYANGLTSFETNLYPGEDFSPYFAQWVADFIAQHFDAGSALAKAG